MKKTGIRILRCENYRRLIQNSVGSRQFRHLFADVGGKKTDLVHGGKYSCALFVSSLLHLCGEVRELHATVDGLLKDLKASGWKKTSKKRPGAVLVWEPKADAEGKDHRHVGFYAGNDRAVSNSSKARAPKRHHWTYGGKRKVIAMYWKPGFEGN